MCSRARATAAAISASARPSSSAAAVAPIRRRLTRNGSHDVSHWSAATRPIVLAQMEVRYFTRRLLSFDYPNVVVLSFQELPADVRIQPVGRVLWSAGALPANARNA